MVDLSAESSLAQSALLAQSFANTLFVTSAEVASRSGMAQARQMSDPAFRTTRPNRFRIKSRHAQSIVVLVIQFAPRTVECRRIGAGRANGKQDPTVSLARPGNG